VSRGPLRRGAARVCGPALASELKEGNEMKQRKMKQTIMMGWSVALVLAAGLSIHAATASATLPEVGRCLPTSSGIGGRYKDGGCTVKAGKRKEVFTGGYEWTALVGEGFLKPMTMIGSLAFETSAGKRIECTELGGRSHAELLGSRGAKTPLWRLHGCTSEGMECKSQEATEAGEIENEYAFFEAPSEEGVLPPGWEGKLGFIEDRGAPSPVVGLSYKIKNDERLFNPVVCRGALGTVWIGGDRKGGDSFIGKVEPVNQMTSELTETLSESSAGIQNPTKFEGKASDVLEAFVENHWEPVAIVATFKYEVEEGAENLKLEIKASP
jgi:hypothetical protein